MRILRSIIIVFVLVLIVVCTFYVFYMQPRYTVPVLMYHSIAEDSGNTLTVTPENFRKQIEYLHKSGYSVISLDELVTGISSGKKFSGREVVLTFDDGFEDNYIKAFPALSKYNMPAIIFLETARIGSQKMYLTWDQVKVMAKSNIEFGGHTKTGVYLPSINDDSALRYQVAGSKADIESNISKEARYFSYPIGGFNDRIKEIVQDAGYKGACTTNRGLGRFNKDVYEINRIKVTDSDMNRPFNFKAKLSGYFNLFRKGKSPD